MATKTVAKKAATKTAAVKTTIAKAVVKKATSTSKSKPVVKAKTIVKSITKATTAKKSTTKVIKEKNSADRTWEIVQISRHKDRPTTFDFIQAIFDDFIEFHGDRQFGDDKAIIGGIASLNGTPVTVIGHQKGSDTEDNIKRRFGMPNPEGYRKALRLMKQAEKFNRPIVTFIDTPGAYPGIEAEERGQGEAIARNLLEMSMLEVPVIAIVIGEGGSGGALALAVADEIWMLENSFYSILSPEGFATILWKDAKRAPEAASMMKSTAKDLKEFGIIDKVINEPKGGIHLNPSVVFKNLKNELGESIKKLTKSSGSSLAKKRYTKFREMGKFNDTSKKGNEKK